MKLSTNQLAILAYYLNFLIQLRLWEEDPKSETKFRVLLIGIQLYKPFLLLRNWEVDRLHYKSLLLALSWAGLIHMGCNIVRPVTKKITVILYVTRYSPVDVY